MFCPYFPTIFFPFPSPSPLLPSSFPSHSPPPPDILFTLPRSRSEVTEVEQNETSKDERQRKRVKISENQTKYNKKMVQQSEKKSAKKCNQFKVGDVVSIKIDRVNKTSLFHPNMLLGNITELENQYARVVTKFGRIQTLISPTRLNLCTATNISLDYTKEITFTSACKQASIQNA